MDRKESSNQQQRRSKHKGDNADPFSLYSSPNQLQATGLLSFLKLLS